MAVKVENGKLVDLKINLDDYRDEESISIEEARALVRGRSGRVALDVIRRWAKKGCRPAGPDGPVLILPALKMSGALRTMPQWVRAFESKRQELGRRAAAPPPATNGRAASADHRRAEAYLDGAGVKAG